MWKRWLILAALVAAAGAHAQTKKELVERALELQRPGIEGTARLLAARAAAGAVRTVARDVARLPAEQRAQVQKQVQEDARAFFNEIEGELRKRAVAAAPETMGNVYEERFTEDELKELIAWLESPVARKYQQALPELQNGLMQKLVADSRGFVDPKIKALQAQLRQRVAAPAPAPAPEAPASPAPAGK